MTLETKNIHQLGLEAGLTQEPSYEDEQAIIDALEGYLRRTSLAQAHPLPRWVRW
ncbi:MAG: hypothetical protein J0H12_05885 [Candidatus Paracaedimonas acanthamoebae]|uniref:Uncharacterized protein n=1 Tax=Candidatus Paracaedimonas acanthamoebae TaxID=244581 RepID=A0A8J7PX99_9PROT|nr:hypothetical protein [Candidatus Paracaedimonas acanthamoebae]